MPKQSLDCVGGPFLDTHTHTHINDSATFLSFTVSISLKLNVKHYMFSLQGSGMLAIEVCLPTSKPSANTKLSDKLLLQTFHQSKSSQSAPT